MPLISIGNNYLYVLEDLKTSEKHSKEAHYNKGNEYFNTGKYKQALREYNKSIQIDNTFDHALLNKAVILMIMGEHKESQKIYNDKLKSYSDQGIKDFRYYLSMNNCGVAYNLSGDFDSALKYFDELLSINNGDEFSHMHKGNSMTGMKNYKKALKSYDKVTELNSKNDLAWFIKGNVYFIIGKYKDACSCFDKTIELKPEFADAYRNKTKALIQQKKNDEALETLNDGLKIKPDSLNLLMDKANNLLLFEKYEDAIKEYDKILDIDPANKQALSFKMVALFKLERYKETLECTEEILKRYPDDKDALERKKLLKDILKKHEEIEKYKLNDDKASPNKNITGNVNAKSDMITIEEAKAQYPQHWVAFQEVNKDDNAGYIIVVEKDYKTFNKAVNKLSINDLYCFYTSEHTGIELN